MGGIGPRALPSLSAGEGRGCPQTCVLLPNQTKPNRYPGPLSLYSLSLSLSVSPPPSLSVPLSVPLSPSLNCHFSTSTFFGSQFRSPDEGSIKSFLTLDCNWSPKMGSLTQGDGMVLQSARAKEKRGLEVNPKGVLTVA